MTQEQLIMKFLEGATEGVCGGGKNLRIKENQLIHYQMPIAERIDKDFIYKCYEVSVGYRKATENIDNQYS